MKYIKAYEDIEYDNLLPEWETVELKYKTGDYVLLKTNLEYDIFKPEFAKIVHTAPPPFYKDSMPYQCVWLLTDEDFFMRENDIERLLTPEEIYKYELKLASKKYNI